MRAYLTSNGVDPDGIDEETFTDICIMWHDGVIGNLGILEAIGGLTAGTFNLNIAKGRAPYTLKDIMPSVHGYLYPPVSEEEQKQQVTNNLLAFAMMGGGAPKALTGK